MNEHVLHLIMIIHFLVVLFVVLTPFFGNNYFLIIHAIFVPFMMLHWYLNDNTCALTLMEKTLRKNIYGVEPDPNDCISYRIIAPVYDFKKNNGHMSGFIYVVTFILWGFTLTRLYSNYRNGKLSRLQDLVYY